MPRDFKKEIAAGRCAENHGCGVMTICMCETAEAAADEVVKMRHALTVIAECAEELCADLENGYHAPDMVDYALETGKRARLALGEK